MIDPKDKSPMQNPGAEIGVEAGEDVITNSDETNKVVNNDGAVADTEGIESNISESDPSTALNADRDITNSQESSGEEPVVN